MSESMKNKLYHIIFEAETPSGRAYDIMLIVSIAVSSLLIMIESIESVRIQYGGILAFFEWIFVFLFSIEYILRLYIVKRKKEYATSFFGLIDLFAILPAFIGLLLPSARYLMVIRVFRLLRLFRIFKMVRYVEESGTLMRALKASKPKITVFLFTVMFIVIISGSLMYIVEGPENGFVHIPESIYWAIVTISTVGYGDISPQTTLGKFISGVLMIIAYGIIAVPTGIITSEITLASKNPSKMATCSNCFSEDHAADAEYCYKCGEKL